MGWPAGKPRGKRIESDVEGETQPVTKRSWKMKAAPNWENINPNEDNPDRFHVPQDIFPEGMSLQWVTDTVYGQAQPQLRADFERKGWTPVHQEDFEGRFDGMFMTRGQEGEINNGGQVLMARPKEITDEAHRRESRKAKEQISIKEAALRGGDIPGVGFDTQHETVRNKVARSWERIAVPTDD